MSGYLELADGAIVPVKDGLVLGRVSACDVVVADSKASRRHARLISEAGVVEIEDMGSSNGTLLNSKPVDRRMLRDGDRIEIGKTVITYREGSAPSQSPPSTGGDLFEDDDDLLGGDSASPSPSPKADAGLLDDEDDELLSASPPAPAASASPAAAPPPPPADVVEFEDEVVEVQKAPPPRAEPQVEVRAAPQSPSPQGGRSGREVEPSSGRILQYSKKQGGSGLLGDDLGQMSGGKRAALVLLVLAVGVGVVYGIMSAMS
ncbi:MAG: FHA domain-containing protein [Planctomycetota bacterium]|nr:FHA domain-containing protein [Planctomycetota bacterium]MEC9046876.1 FHA domain-containing protein [Planctomycetota bacterium]